MLYEDNTAKLLGLEEVIVKKVWDEGQEKHIEIELPRRKHICPCCGKRFYEENCFLPRYHRMTSRKNVQIIEDFRDTVSASYIARKHNIFTTTALRYFSLVNYSCRELPEVLSIDEFKGNAGGEKYQTILTDAGNKKMIDILPASLCTPQTLSLPKSCFPTGSTALKPPVSLHFENVPERSTTGAS